MTGLKVELAITLHAWGDVARCGEMKRDVGRCRGGGVGTNDSRLAVDPAPPPPLYLPYISLHLLRAWLCTQRLGLASQMPVLVGEAWSGDEMYLVRS